MHFFKIILKTLLIMFCHLVIISACAAKFPVILSFLYTNLKLVVELLKVELSLILEEVKVKNGLNPSTFISFSFKNSIYSFRLTLE